MRGGKVGGREEGNGQTSWNERTTDARGETRVPCIVYLYIASLSLTPPSKSKAAAPRNYEYHDASPILPFGICWKLDEKGKGGGVCPGSDSRLGICVALCQHA